MDKKQGGIQGWLETATGGIRFGPDRRAVRAELEGHLEDKRLDLQRIFPGMTEAEAEERALSEMGDAQEIGKELAKIHKPWLGYLWRASKWAAIVLTVALVAVNVVNREDYQAATHPIWGEFRQVYGPTRGEKAQLGGYTFQIVGAAYLDYPEDKPVYCDRVEIAVRVSTPRFWERIDRERLERALTLVDGAGRAWPMAPMVIEQAVETPERSWWLSRTEWGVFHDTYVAEAETDWREGDRIQLEFTFGKGSFTLETDKLERVVMK